MRPIHALLVGRALPLLLVLGGAGCNASTTVLPTTSTGTGSSGGTTTGGTTTGGPAGTTTGGGTSSGGSGSSSSSSGGTTGGVDGGCHCPVHQFCDPLDGGQCLVCLSDSNCGATSPVCDTDPSSSNYGLCVGCTRVESFCGQGNVCDYLWYSNMFEQCVADCRVSDAGTACPSDAAKNLWRHCDSATGLCLSGCVQSSDCVPGEPFCLADSGVCVACRSAEDCPYSHPGCHGGACGFCTATTDCRAGQECSGDRCVCAASAQCGGDAPVCELPSQTARLGSCGCGSSGDCAPLGEVCEPTYESYTNVAGACVPSCVDGGTDCLQQVFPFNYCNPANGICTTCSSDTQCAGDAGLSGSHCLDAGFCGCFSMADCPAGTACDPLFGQCAQSCVNIPGQCPWNTVCDPRSGLCVQCLQDSDCANLAPAFAYCLNDVDAGTTCAACLIPAECPSDKPGCSSQSFKCGACERDADCPPSYPHCIGPPSGYCA